MDVKLIILALVVAIFLGLAVLAGLRAGRRLPKRTGHDPGVEGNARLTGYAAIMLLLPLAAAVVSGVRPGLSTHVGVGFLLVPPVLLKLSTVGYRFGRYYTGQAGYRAAGPPELVMRIMGPALVLLTVALFGTGIELWLFGDRLGYQWRAWHKAAFVLWLFLMTVHVVAYRQRAPALAIADTRAPLPGVPARRSLVIATLLLGVVLAFAMLAFPSPFTPLSGAG